MFFKKMWLSVYTFLFLLSGINAEDREDLLKHLKIKSVDFTQLSPEDTTGVFDVIKKSPTVERFLFGKLAISFISALSPNIVTSYYHNMTEAFKNSSPEGYGVNEHYLVEDTANNNTVVGWFNIHSNPDPMPSPYEEDGKTWILSTRIFPSGVSDGVAEQIEKKFLKKLSFSDKFSGRTFLLETYKGSKQGDALAKVLKGDFIGEITIKRSFPPLISIQHKNIQAYKIHPEKFED